MTLAAGHPQVPALPTYYPSRHQPENILFGHPDGNRAEKLHLIDFGLATYYRDPVSKQHRPLQDKQNMVGTVHYASRNLLQ
jgi:casein kinase 1